MSANAFVRIPKILFSNEEFKAMTSDAKLLYALMDDRSRLSAMNGWYDENGELFIFFSISDVCRVLNCHTGKACRVVTELERAGLIRRRKRGQGRPAMIYVSSVQTSQNRNS